MSHQVCPEWDGVCDTEVDPTTCNYCDFDEYLCTPGVARDYYMYTLNRSFRLR